MRITVEKIGDYTGVDAGGWWVLAIDVVTGQRTSLAGPYRSDARADLALIEIEATMRRHAQAELAAARRAA